MNGITYESGERLAVYCEPVDARVVKVTRRHVYVEWPWREPDVGTRMQWDGTMVFPLDPSNPDWANTPWRLEPDPEELSAGGACLVGIPRTVVKVERVHHFDPPLVVGWIPRPTMGLEVVDERLEGDEEAGYMLYLGGPEPIEIERVSIGA